MSRKISPLAHVDPRAELGADVEIGPFCVIGPDVVLGDGCTLVSHVTLTGHTTVGEGNRFWPGVVIGGEPQDLSYRATNTHVVIGDGNQFREGVTVNRGSEKEDRTTRIGNNNLLMSNSHVAHNCRLFNQVILVNGVLLGGHVHVHDGAIVSGNTVVHHYSTIGTLAFVSGGCRVPHDIPPYMLASGSDNPTISTINIVGLRRRGISERSIRLLKTAHRLIYRQNKSLEEVRDYFRGEDENVIPFEVSTLLHALEQQRRGKLGRAREAFRDEPPADEQQDRSAA